MNNGERTGARAIGKRSEVKQMLDLRKQGYTLEEVALSTGFSITYVSKCIKKALSEITAEVALDVIGLEVARLDALWLKAYARATADGKAFSKESMDVCIRLMERRAKLMGLDKPTKVANTNPAGDKEAEQVMFYLPSNGRDMVVVDES